MTNMTFIKNYINVGYYWSLGIFWNNGNVTVKINKNKNNAAKGGFGAQAPYRCTNKKDEKERESYA